MTVKASPVGHRPLPGHTPRDVPPAASQRPATPQARVETFDPDEVFSSSPRRASGERTGLAEMIMVTAGSGGAGGTTMALGLAQRAAERGKRVILIDATLGRGDITLYLHLERAVLPTVYDAATLANGDVRASLISPAELFAERHKQLRPLKFALLQAPTREELYQGAVTAHTVWQMLRQARELSDLVVIDLPHLEPDDPREILRSLLLPALGRGSWLVGMATVSPVSTKHLSDLLDILIAEGISLQHLITGLNKVTPALQEAADVIAARLRDRSLHFGALNASDSVITATNYGETVADDFAFAVVLDEVLQLVLEMEPIAKPEPPQLTRRLPKLWGKR